MNETTYCAEYCYANIYTTVHETEALINYMYASKDYKTDEMFGGRNFSFPCKDYVLHYECPSVHRIKYFCRLVWVYKNCVTDTSHDSVVHRMCISVVMYDLVNAVHVTFRVCIDITGQQYTNGISIPLIHLEEVECLGLLQNLQNKERFVNQTKQNIQWLYDLLLENYGQNIYKPNNVVLVRVSIAH